MDPRNGGWIKEKKFINILFLQKLQRAMFRAPKGVVYSWIAGKQYLLNWERSPKMKRTR